VIRRPPPLLAQHTEEVLRELGYSDAEIGQLAEDGAVLLCKEVEAA
jgi:crotonobetainyl-CoA:carnitine CoA-transferase CaiB-like acyl-CoA transferase